MTVEERDAEREAAPPYVGSVGDSRASPLWLRQGLDTKSAMVNADEALYINSLADNSVGDPCPNHASGRTLVQEPINEAVDVCGLYLRQTVAASGHKVKMRIRSLQQRPYRCPKRRIALPY